MKNKHDVDPIGGQTFLTVPAAGTSLSINFLAGQYVVEESRRWWDGDASNDEWFRSVA